jgi:5-methylcytosine-specific restriction endonuclease McrA
MPYTEEELNYIFNKNNGCCWHCGKKLVFTNHGRKETKGAWEVDQSNPMTKGKKENVIELVPSCIECNRSKNKYSYPSI